jgi:hypothetical protein
LLGEDIGFGTVGAKRDNGGDVPNVPAFAEHEHGDDAEKRTGAGVEFAAEFAEGLEVLVADFLFAFDKLGARVGAFSDFLEFAFKVGVEIDRAPVQFLEDGVAIEASGDFIGGLLQIGPAGFEQNARLLTVAHEDAGPRAGDASMPIRLRSGTKAAIITTWR